MKRSKKVIAVELDQTLVPTLDTFLAWHNDTYDTDMALASIYGNSNIRDLSRALGGTKLREFYDSAAFSNMMPLKDADDDDDMETNNDDVNNGTLGIGHQQKLQKQRWGALEVLQALKKRKWKLLIVTYRPQFTQAVTQRFIDRYYPGLFDGIYYCNQGLPVADQLDYVPKPITIMCQEIGADYLIDDTLEHCLDCSMLDMTLLLYDHHGKYTYNHLSPPQKRPKYGRPSLTSSSKQLYQRSASSRSSLTSLPENVIRVKSWKQILDQFPMPTSPLRFCHYPITAPRRQQQQPPPPILSTPGSRTPTATLANHNASSVTSASLRRRHPSNTSRHSNTTTTTTTAFWNNDNGKRQYDQILLSDENDYSPSIDLNDDYSSTSDDDDYQSTSWTDRDAIAV